jgi:hypothetical protein
MKELQAFDSVIPEKKIKNKENLETVAALNIQTLGSIIASH